MDVVLRAMCQLQIMSPVVKETAIQSFNLWSALGKPRMGAEFDCMRRDKLLYKLAIKETSANDANQFF